jgi:hypothetical protein
VITLLVFTACEKDEITEPEEELTGFEFPRVTYVDSLVYLEIQKTCKVRWNLSMMDSESLIILSYKNEYVVYCEGQQDNQYYWFVISTDLNGKWKNDGKSPYLGRGSIFNVKSIDKLQVENLKGFWNENSTLDSEYSTYTMFESHPGYLNNYRISDENSSNIELSFFKTKADAVEAMENRRNNVASVINQGTSTALPGLWWYTESIPNAVFVSRWNVLLEVDIYSSDFKVVEDSLFNTANEILRRMSLLLD